MNRIINIGAFAILAILWLGFGAALVLDRGMLDMTWQMFGSWPPVLQVLIGLLVLPLIVGLWIWETAWPLVVRVLLIAGLAGATVYIFFPKKTPSQPDRASSTD